MPCLTPSDVKKRLFASRYDANRGLINSQSESFKVIFLIIEQPLSCILYFIPQVSCLMPTLMTIEQISKLLSSRGK
jgi:hypothetical protein